MKLAAALIYLLNFSKYDRGYRTGRHFYLLHVSLQYWTTPLK